MEEALLQLLQNVALGVLSILGAYIIKATREYSNKLIVQSNSIKSEEQKELVQKAINRLTELTVKTTQTAEVTLVKGIKDSTSDGKITKEDGQAMLQLVKEEVLNMATEDVKELASQEINDLDLYIEKVVEVTLAQIKGQL